MAKRRKGTPKQVMKAIEQGTEARDEAAQRVIENTKIDFPVMGLPKMSLKFSADPADSAFEDLKLRHEKGVKAVKEAISKDLDEMMAASWGWTGGARDIIDTGALKESKKVAVSGDDILISYGAAYAQLIHYGGYVLPYGNPSAQKVYIPGRPWVGAVLGVENGPLEATDWQSVYRDAIS